MRVISQKCKGINMYDFAYETTGFGVKASPDRDGFNVIACFGMGYDYVMAKYETCEEAEKAMDLLRNTALNSANNKEFRFPATV